MERRVLPVLLVLLSLTAWTACGGGEGGSEEMSAEDTTAMTEAPPTIAGSTLTTTVTPEEAMPDSGAHGNWEIMLADDGTFAVRHDGTADVEGTYMIDGDRVTFTDTSGEFMCDPVTGVYRWSISGDQVTMSVVDDACDGRITVLTAHSLTRGGA